MCALHISILLTATRARFPLVPPTHLRYALSHETAALHIFATCFAVITDYTDHFSSFSIHFENADKGRERAGSGCAMLLVYRGNHGIAISEKNTKEERIVANGPSWMHLDILLFVSPREYASCMRSGQRECKHPSSAMHRAARPMHACIRAMLVTLVFYHVKHRGGCVGRFTRVGRFRSERPARRVPAAIFKIFNGELAVQIAIIVLARERKETYPIRGDIVDQAFNVCTILVHSGKWKKM